MKEHQDDINDKEKFTNYVESILLPQGMPHLQTLPRNFDLKSCIIKTLYRGQQRYNGHEDHAIVVDFVVSADDELVHAALLR